LRSYRHRDRGGNWLAKREAHQEIGRDPQCSYLGKTVTDEIPGKVSGLNLLHGPGPFFDELTDSGVARPNAIANIAG
jgi:hypothetical protein